MREIAENSKDAEKAIEQFCETYKATALQDPPETFDEVGGRTDVPEIPDFVQKYREDGAEAYEAAILFHGQFLELKAAGADIRETPEEFVANNIRGVSA